MERSQQSEIASRRARVEVALVLAFACVLFAVRFIDLDHAPFIQDEPLLQLRVDEVHATGKLPTHGIEGSKGVRYGPVPLWFYLAVRTLSDDVNVITVCWGLLLTAGLWLLAWVIRRQWGSRVAAWLLLLLASSPHFVFYTRQPWDNPMLIATGALVVFVAHALARAGPDAGLRRAALLAAGLGLATALCFNIHLMSMPLVIGSALWLAVHLSRMPGWRIRVVGGAAFVVTFLLVSAPYLISCLAEIGKAGHLQWSGEGVLAALERILLRSGLVLGTDGFQELFPEPHRVTLERLHGLATLQRLDPGWILRIGALVVALRAALRIAPGRAGWRERLLEAPLEAFAALVLVLHFLYFYGAGIDVKNPSYNNGVAFTAPVLIAGWLARARPLGQALLKSLLLVVVCANVAYLATLHRLVVENTGLRTTAYNSARAEVRRATGLVCRAMTARGQERATVDLRRTELREIAVRYLAAHLDSCRGKELDVIARGDAREKLVFHFDYGTRGKLDASLRVTSGGADVTAWVPPAAPR